MDNYGIVLNSFQWTKGKGSFEGKLPLFFWFAVHNSVGTAGDIYKQQKTNQKKSKRQKLQLENKQTEHHSNQHTMPCHKKKRSAAAVAAAEDIKWLGFKFCHYFMAFYFRFMAGECKFLGATLSRYSFLSHSPVCVFSSQGVGKTKRVLYANFLLLFRFCFSSFSISRYHISPK